MSLISGIEWTKKTWNPTEGCDKVSSGRKLCCTEAIAEHELRMGVKKYTNGFRVTLYPYILDPNNGTRPLKWKKAKRTFIKSPGYLFHKDSPLEYAQQMFNVMGRAHRQTVQILAKRSKRLAELAFDITWHKIMWMGVSAETPKYCSRTDNLRCVPAAVLFLFLDLLLEPLTKINLDGVQWVTVGGESRPYMRMIDKVWVDEVRDIWRLNHPKASFFFKQRSGETGGRQNT